MKTIFKRVLLPILLIAAIVSTVTVLAMAENDEDNLTDAMIEILADETLAAHKIGTYALANDGYLGIPVDFTFYHDDSFAVNNSYNGTALIMYVVNTRTVRAGTDSDVEIIRSMLERGYVVAVADYHNHKKAVANDIEWSTQHVNRSLIAGSFFSSAPYKSGFKETFIVPAGHNVELGRVFWEFDKHSTNGTLEEIVAIWNVDFRSYKGTKYVKWVGDNGRKATQDGFDGTSPVWYSYDSATGKYTVDNENGEYVQVKHTKALTITDCVKPDGTPIDLSLYMHIVYPTNPTSTVPTLTLASSSEHLASGSVSANRPHTYGFAFDGYAIAMYDFAYVPMARNDHYGYFDGSSMDKGSITGDNFTYNLFTYNSALVPTAAMRYLRYLGLTEGETFRLNGTIGVIGNSKGSMITHLADLELGYTKSLSDGYTDASLLAYAEEYINSFGNYYYHDGYSGETRFEAGLATYTKDGFTIDGGEYQPWLICEGEMIPSNAQFVYSSCGGMTGDIDENYGAFMTSAYYGDETSAFGGNGQFYSLADVYDLPFLGYTLKLGHTFLQRESLELGVDPYVGYKEFAHYFLRNDAPTVLYVTPVPSSDISLTPTITVKFAGIVSAAEIAKATLTDKNGNAVLGVWTSSYGGTEWDFTPTFPLAGDAEYTLTVPNTLKAENGKALREEFVTQYYTQGGQSNVLSEAKATLTDKSGLTFTVTVPDMSNSTNGVINRALLDVFVSGDNANTLRVSKDNASGALIDELPLRGAGHYALDLTDFFGGLTPGSKVTLYLSASKTPSKTYSQSSALKSEDFEDGAHGFKTSANATTSITEMDGHGKVLAVSMLPKESTLYPDHKFYNFTTAISYSNFALSSVSEKDYGRRFTLTFDVYDTESRMIRVSFGNLMSEANGVIDYDIDMKNLTTKAGEWVTFTVEFDFYNREYGKSVLTKNKTLSINVEPIDGDTRAPVYFDNFELTETITEIEVGSVSLSLTNEGGTAYKYGNGEKPFLVGGTAYATLKEAISALGSNDGTVTLQGNVTLSGTEAITNIYAKNITLDLNGYQIRTDVLNTSLISVNTEKVKSITLKNGSVYLSGGSLVGFENSKLACDVDVTLENVFIGTEPAAMVRQLLINTTASFTAKVRLNLTECTVDMRESGFAKNPVTMLPTSTDKLTLSLTMTGGSVLLSRTDHTTLADTIRDIYFKNGKDGMPVIYLSEYRAIGTISAMTDQGFAYFKANDSIDARMGYIAYTPTISEGLSTPYGIIPEEYADAEKYPFVVFESGTFNFIGAASILIQDSGTDGAINLVYKTAGAYSIYLRRDFTHDIKAYNIAFVNSDLIIDLGGHTLTYNYTICAQAKTASYNSRVTFKNGTLAAHTTSPLFTVQGLTQTQTFAFTFDHIIFTTDKGYSPSVWISSTSTGTPEKAKEYSLTTVIANCTFDMTNITSNTTLVKIGHPTGLNSDKTTLIGGHILGSPEKLSLYTMSSAENCSFTHQKGEDGHYLTNTRLTTSEVPSMVINTDEGAKIFNVVLSSEGDYTTYGLGNDPMLTPYGRIPAEYAADPETYAMLLFNTKTGEVIWAGSKWGGETKTDGSSVGGILEAMKSNCSKGSLAIYLQADVTVSDKYFNHGNTTGTHIIDLNGHTITLKTDMFQAQAKNKRTSCTAHFTIKNGTIDAGASPLLVIGSNTYTDGSYGMTATYVFENVNITNISSGSSLVLDTLGGNFVTTTNVIFRNSTLSFNSGRSKALFELGFKSGTKDSTNFTVNITIEGGSIVTADAKIPTFLSVLNGMTNKTLTVAKGTDGYPTLTVKKISTFTDGVTYMTANGERYLALDHTTDTQSLYTFGVKTAYGIIPATYENAKEYPFLIFNLDKGTFVKAVKIYSDETLDSALGYCRTTTGNFVILLQCDFTTASGVADYNFGSMGGTLIFDLGGHTLTLSASLYHAQAKTDKEMTVITKNGTVVISKNTAAIGLGSSFRATAKFMHFTFENVTFRITGSDCKLVSDTTSGGYMTADLTFNGCTFISSLVMPYEFFHLGNYPDSSEIAITVNGGEFIINTSAKLPIYLNVNGAAKHTFAIGKYNGAYPTVTAPSGLNVSEAIFNGEDGLLGLRRIGKADSKRIYEFTPLTFVSAYLNLASDLNLIYRTYVPFGYEAPTVTFTIGNRTYTVSEYTVDENGLYCFRLPNITPAEMGKVVTATLTASANGERTTVSHSTLSVKGYLETLRTQNASDAALLDLIDKLLVYGAAAQQYIGEDELVSEIGTPAAIPESENTLTLTGESSNLAAIVKVGMRLDGSFALRITVRTFGSKGLMLVATHGDEVREYDLSSYKKEDGEITVIYDGITACELGDVITFSIRKDGATVGKTLTLTPNAYLYRLTASEDESLATLAKATYAYGISAKAYASK